LKSVDLSVENDLEFGHSLLRSGNIVAKSAKESVQGDVDNFEDRKSALDALMTKEKSR